LKGSNKGITVLSVSEPTTITGEYSVIIGVVQVLVNLFTMNLIKSTNIKSVLFDDAHLLTGVNTKECIRTIIRPISKSVQFVSTFTVASSEYLTFQDEIMRDPLQMDDPLNFILPTIREFYVKADTDDSKFNVLKTIYQSMSKHCSIIIFFNSQKKLLATNDLIISRKWSPCGIAYEGGPDFDKVIDNFAAGKYKVLLATNIVSYAIHFPNCKAVVNYDLPSLSEQGNNYIQRVGRAGNSFKKGIAVTIVTSDSNIEELKEISPQIEEMPTDFNVSQLL